MKIIKNIGIVLAMLGLLIVKLPVYALDWIFRNLDVWIALAFHKLMILLDCDPFIEGALEQYDKNRRMLSAESRMWSELKDELV